MKYTIVSIQTHTTTSILPPRFNRRGAIKQIEGHVIDFGQRHDFLQPSARVFLLSKLYCIGGS